MIVTPGQFTQRAEFYHQLSQLTGAGLGLVRSLDQLSRNPPGFSYRRPLQRVLEGITQGHTLTEALRNAGRWLPDFDLTLIDAGERSGRLDACFRLLAEYYTERARLARQMIGDMLYPVFLYHFAVFVLAFIQFVRSGNWPLILVVGLVPVYLAIFFFIYAGQSKHSENWRALVETALHPVPLLGTARRYLALARLAASLEALISAGVNIIEAWEMAAAASGSPELHRLVSTWRPLLSSGQTPAEIVNASHRFPDMFTNQYQTGEVSGKLDDALRRLHRYYQEEGSRKLHMVSQWIPRLIYIGVALMVGYIVIQFWSGYFQQFQNLGLGM